jgi:hypothetical protein
MKKTCWSEEIFDKHGGDIKAFKEHHSYFVKWVASWVIEVSNILKISTGTGTLERALLPLSQADWLVHFAHSRRAPVSVSW